MQRKGEESVTLSCVLWPAGAGEAEDCSFQETQCAQWTREVDVVEPPATRAGCTSHLGFGCPRRKTVRALNHDNYLLPRGRPGFPHPLKEMSALNPPSDLPWSLAVKSGSEMYG